MPRQRTAWVEPFLAQLARGASVPVACRAVGIVPATAYEHRQRHPDFAAAWALARQSGRDPGEEGIGVDGIGRIALRRKGGAIAAYSLVDAEDYPALARYRWFLDSEGYARRSTSIGSRTDGTRRVIAIKLHRAVAGLERGDPRQVDHVNGNRLDNRRANLRVLASLAEQAQNRPSDAGSTSRYRGVCWHKQHRKWYASVMVAGKRRFLGLFADEDEAGRVAAEARRAAMPYAIDR